MSKMRGAIVIDVERCKGCMLCTVSCPRNVIALAEGKHTRLPVCGSYSTR